MSSFIKHKNLIVFLFPPIFIVLMLLVNLGGSGFMHFIWGPEQLLEQIQSIFLLGATLSSSLIFLRSSKNKLITYMYLIFSIALFLLFMEEINWGQVYFNFSTPEEIAENNAQGQTSIHNLNIFQKNLHLIYIIVGLCWVLAPYLFNSLKRYKLISQFKDLVPSKILFFYFFFVSVYYYYFQYGRTILQDLLDRTLDAPSQEIFEFLMYLGFLIYSIDLYNTAKQNFLQKRK